MFRIFILVLALAACSHTKTPENFSYQEIDTTFFKLASWQKISNASAPYIFYIEGDGYAFDSKGRATKNPTPHSTLVRKFAFEDAHQNVIYLARPCQFVEDEKCMQKYWTTARFSEEVIESTAEAIKKIAQDNDVALIGYSGGAQVAGLVAVKNPEIRVKRILTIAGNLDHPAWTSYHHLPALQNSLDLNDYKTVFSKIPQRHFVGEKDDVIPVTIIENFISDKTTLVKIPTASHTEGWEMFSTNFSN